MIEFDFYYRKQGSAQPFQKGCVTIGTARQRDDDWCCRITISKPKSFDGDIFGVDALQAVEESLRFALRMLETSDSYEISRWDNDLTAFEPSPSTDWGCDAYFWVFVEEGARLPSGIFSSKELAFEWISEHRLSGLLTAYPKDEGVFEWAQRKGHWKPAKEGRTTAESIGNFTSAYLEHSHFEEGRERGGE